MTIICALHDPETRSTWIGSDRRAVDNGTKVDVGPKWTLSDGWAVGHAGNLRAANLLQANADDLFHDLDGPLTFTNRVRSILEADGFNKDSAEGPGCWGQQMILATADSVWSIGITLEFYVIEAGEFWADGSGRSFALGAAFAHHGDAEHKVHAALMAAITYETGCGGEPWIHELTADADHK